MQCQECGVKKVPSSIFLLFRGIQAVVAVVEIEVVVVDVVVVIVVIAVAFEASIWSTTKIKLTLNIIVSILTD